MATAAVSGPHPPQQPHQSFWLWVMCLTGVDYFSTLGYQPSIAFEYAGILAPLATLILVAMTLFGAFPIYAHVARQSPHGQGSIAMLARLVHGWTGKLLVLGLLGFAATDFVITKTMSAADAAKHLVENPLWSNFRNRLGVPEWVLGAEQILVACFFLVLLGGVFLRGFREVIGLAVAIVVTYMGLNAVVIGASLHHLYEHPEKVSLWYERLRSGQWFIQEAPLSGGGWWTIGLVCLLLFPKLALGLSGFETGVAVMPLIRGRPGDAPASPEGRIRNTRKLLFTAAVIMSVYLLGSSVATSMLIQPAELIGPNPADPGRPPPARERALAFIAHGEGSTAGICPLFGEFFGTIYDVSTVVILWFAGASAMAGLLNLVPQYLPRYGMAPEWAGAMRPLVVLFTGIGLLVTLLFRADVTAQGAAYATGVLVLMSSACLATLIDRWRARHGPWLVRTPWLYVLIFAAFLYTTIDTIIYKKAGMAIAACFTITIIVTSAVSRAKRSTELRFQGFEFVDNDSRFLWESIKHLEFQVLVPHRPGRRALSDKEADIRREHRIAADVPIVFVEAELGDTSEFYQTPLLSVVQEEGRFVLRVTRCVSIPHVLAALGLELSRFGQPPEIHFGWSDESPIAANLGFLLFGEGNIPWMVRELIRKAEANPERQPKIVIG